jgi:hypothetical protein
MTQANLPADPAINAAEFAMQMLRFPLRQVFGDTTVPQTVDAFVATIQIKQLKDSFGLAARVLGP